MPPICQGTRLGCPLSPLLLTIFLELLAIHIQENKKIKGLDPELKR